MLSTLISCLLIIIVSTGCTSAGGEQSPSQTPSVQSSQPSPTASGLTAFLNTYVEAKFPAWQAMEKKFEEEQNINFSFLEPGFIMADLALTDFALYDTRSVPEGDPAYIPVWTNSNGSLFEFGCDHVFPQDVNQNKKGDHIIAAGKFDVAGMLSYDWRVESGGVITQRTVIEIVQNADGSYASRVFFIGSNGYLIGALVRFKGADIEGAQVEKAAGLDCTIDSIWGKQDVTIQDMAAGYEIVFSFSYIDGQTASQLKQE